MNIRHIQIGAPNVEMIWLVKILSCLVELHHRSSYLTFLKKNNIGQISPKLKKPHIRHAIFIRHIYTTFEINQYELQKRYTTSIRQAF